MAIGNNLGRIVLVIGLSALLFSTSLMGQYFDSDGVEIHYSDSDGAGEVVVLVHGYSMDSRMWREAGISEALSKSHRVIALDCRGHGKSDKPTAEEDYGPKVGTDIINLLDHLEIDRAHLVGYSMGAYIVARLAITHPQRIHSVVLGSGYFPSDDVEELTYQEQVALDMQQHGELALAAVARGWKADAVSDAEIANISLPVQAVFGSEEIDEVFRANEARLKMPKSALPIVIVEGADHDSERAAVLTSKFLETVLDTIAYKH